MARLRDGFSWCLCGDRLVLLDLPADRYLALPPELEAGFRLWAEQDLLDEETCDGLVALGIVEQGGDRAPVPVEIVRATHDLTAGLSRRRRWTDLLRALAAQGLAASRIRKPGLARLVSRPAKRAQVLPPAQAMARAAELVGAFERSALLIRKFDRCLPRAVAMWSLCRKSGVGASLVLGVRLEPFSAHSWVQLDEAVLVGDFEQARLFTPILAVS